MKGVDVKEKKSRLGQRKASKKSKQGLGFGTYRVGRKEYAKSTAAGADIASLVFT